MTKKWQDFLTYLQWEGIKNWKIVTREKLEEVIPQAQQWILEHLKYINDHDVRIALKDFYILNTPMTKQYDYHHKNMGLAALQAMYWQERND